jgi:hypothetical protein
MLIELYSLDQSKKISRKKIKNEEVFTDHFQEFFYCEKKLRSENKYVFRCQINQQH